MNRSKVGLFALGLMLAACSEHATNTAVRSVSPLIGTWVRDGGTPKPDPNQPQFTKLTFAADGSLTAEYVAAGGQLTTIVGGAPKLRTERDSYTTPGDATLQIAEGSSRREYQYRVSGAKLFLTAPGSSDANEFSKAGEP